MTINEKKFLKWCEKTHPEICDEFKKIGNGTRLDTTDKTPWDLTWNEEQKKVLDEICNRMDRDSRGDRKPYISWTNWDEIPYIGQTVAEFLEDPPWERYQNVDLLEDVLERIFPFEDDPKEEYFETDPRFEGPILGEDFYKRMTVGQMNEILLFLRDEANTSAKFDW